MPSGVIDSDPVILGMDISPRNCALCFLPFGSTPESCFSVHVDLGKVRGSWKDEDALKRLYDTVLYYCEGKNIFAGVIEDYAYGGFSVVPAAERAAICKFLVGTQLGYRVPILRVAPSSLIKFVTGKGKTGAGKGKKFILRSKAYEMGYSFDTDHESDAFFLALLGISCFRRNWLLPDSSLEVVELVSSKLDETVYQSKLKSLYSS